MIARAKREYPKCSTSNCKGIVRARCQMGLRGVLEGTLCARPLCVSCTVELNGSKFCRAHKSGKLW